MKNNFKQKVYIFFGLISLFLLVSNKTIGQQEQILINENIFTYKSYIARLRPVVYTVSIENYRFDVMLGKKIFNPLTAYIYWKYDNFNINRLGFRVDYIQNFLNDKLKITLQYRYFWGINSKSTNQAVYVPSFDFQFYKIRLGIWSLMVQNKGSDLVPYVGPATTIPFGKHAGIFFAYTKDLTKTKYLFYTILFFKFDFTPKEEPKQ